MADDIKAAKRAKKKGGDSEGPQRRRMPSKFGKGAKECTMERGDEGFGMAVNLSLIHI